MEVSPPVQYNTSISESDFSNLHFWSSIVNGISLVAAGLVVVAVLVCKQLGVSAARRLTFRMSLWIALFDMLFSAFSFVNVDDDPTLCPIFSAITYFCNLVYVFLTTSITLNLHLSFLTAASITSLRIKHKLLKEHVLVIGSCVFALIITLPPLFIAMSQNQCVLFHTVSHPAARVGLLWVTVGGWEAICFLYTTVIVILVAKQLQQQSERLSRARPARPNLARRTGVFPGSGLSIEEGQVDNVNRIVKRRASPGLAPPPPPAMLNSSIPNTGASLSHSFERVARRLLMYPLIPIITQSFYIGINSYFLYVGERTLIPLYLFYIVPYSAGLLNSLAFFLLDPVVPELIQELKDRYALRNASTYGWDDENEEIPPELAYAIPTADSFPFNNNEKDPQSLFPSDQEFPPNIPDPVTEKIIDLYAKSPVNSLSKTPTQSIPAQSEESHHNESDFYSAAASPTNLPKIKVTTPKSHNDINQSPYSPLKSELSNSINPTKVELPPSYQSSPASVPLPLTQQSSPSINPKQSSSPSIHPITSPSIHPTSILESSLEVDQNIIMDTTTSSPIPFHPDVE